MTATDILSGVPAMTVIGAAVSVIGWAIKRQVIDRLDKMEAKLDTVKDTINEMAVQNARDHATVQARLKSLESTVNKQTHESP